MLWFVTIAAILGAYLNAQELRISFLIWIVTNAIWIFVNLRKKPPQYEQAVLFAVYLFISIYGWINWG